jgi:hypothetical protein
LILTLLEAFLVHTFVTGTISIYVTELSMPLAILVAPAEHVSEFPAIGWLYDNNSAIGLSLRVVFSFVVVVGLSAR